MCIYIYIEREMPYIYIYIYRERERCRRPTRPLQSRLLHMASLSSEFGCGVGRPLLAVLLVHGPVFVEQDLHERLLDVLQ